MNKKIIIGISILGILIFGSTLYLIINSNNKIKNEYSNETIDNLNDDKDFNSENEDSESISSNKETIEEIKKDSYKTNEDLEDSANENNEFNNNTDKINPEEGKSMLTKQTFKTSEGINLKYWL